MEGSYSLSGGLLGGTLGYNLQAGTSSFVLGGEVDLAWSNVKGTTPAFTAQVVSFNPVTGAPIVTPTPGCFSKCEITSPWLATARLRFGYSFDYLGDALDRFSARVIAWGRDRHGLYLMAERSARTEEP